MTINYTAIGQRIRTIRKRQGISQSVLSEMIDNVCDQQSFGLARRCLRTYLKKGYPQRTPPYTNQARSLLFLPVVFLRQYRTNRQGSLPRDFSSEKGGKPQEYFVYFKVLRTNFWRKRSGRIRRRICAVLP